MRKDRSGVREDRSGVREDRSGVREEIRCEGRKVLCVREGSHV